ncbi:hypothetical protein [Streptomyces mesophilus]|uniref:hypothetical protein n=1 Tax=Streptomyces mesophilus TaxID=1775132 RepID=UPI003328BED8
MDTRRARGTTVRRTFRPAIRTPVMHTRRACGTTVRRTFRPAIRTPIVDTRRARGATVRRAFGLVRVLLGVRHVSSWKSTVVTGREP